MKLLTYLSEKEKKELTAKKLQKNEVLFREGQRCREIGIVLHGSLIITSFLENGTQIIYNTLEQNDMFGNNLLFSSDPFYKGDVLAAENSEVLLIREEELLGLMSDDPLFLKEYLKIQSDTGKDLHFQIRLLSIDSAQERLFYYLHEHSGRIRFTSVSALSKQLFLSRETLSRLLSKLTKEKRIIKEDDVIRLI